MKNRLFARAAMAAALVVVSAVSLRAQSSDAVGIRAQGMAGAFTAVADDATASWWNPGGLATGAYFSGVVETSHTHQPKFENAIPAWDNESRGFAVGFPALALSYYHLAVSEIQRIGPIAAGVDGRQDEVSPDIRLRSLVMSQFGVTVGQSLGNHLVVATTAKLMRGSVVTAVRPAAGASVDMAKDLEGPTDTEFGLDIGAMAKIGGLRAGLMVRNVEEPAFGERLQEVKLDRQFRAGIAYSSRSSITTVSADIDINTVTLPTGEERRFAAGLEGWSRSHRIGLRGGVSFNTLGDALVSASAGASLAVRSSTFIDAFGTFGADETRQGWGIGLRVTF
jgi:F plasmid transfer operon, TraF, protein